MVKSRKDRTSSREADDKISRSLKCFENQPNINMAIPWIYDMAKTLTRDSDAEEDEISRSLRCFENQPNINMAVPWIYEIYKRVKSASEEGGGGTSALEWEDLTSKASDSEGS